MIDRWSVIFFTLTIPLVADLRRMQATTEPNSWAIQYSMARSRVMCPQTKAPSVTAGLTWPPEMLAPTETATKSANACAKADANRLVAGSTSAILSAQRERERERL